ncbi:MAG: helix-turn-helix domain-containing protein [Pseudomonadota bacterium]|nr:helix-turn-helix domain-containing protein [Pseudomonadota bacterium]
MSIDATSWAWKAPVQSCSQRIVLLALADRAGEDHTAWPSAERLHQDTCLNIKTIPKVLKELMGLGLIMDTGERKGSSRRVVVYRLIGVVDRMNPPKSGGGQYPQKRDIPKNGGIRYPQKRNTPEKGIHPKTDVSHSQNTPTDTPENGGIRSTQNWDTPENGIHPITDLDTPKNGWIDTPKNGCQNLSLESKKNLKSVRTQKNKTAIPEDFGISEAVLKWATEQGHTHLQQHLESFIDKAKSKQYQYADWDAAFREAIRKNWAGVGANPSKPAAYSQQPSQPQRQVESPKPESQRRISLFAGLELFTFNDLRKLDPQVTQIQIREVAQQQGLDAVLVMQQMIQQLKGQGAA